MCTPLSGLEQHSVLIGASIWYQTNLVLDMNETHTRKKPAREKWSQFMVPVSAAFVMGINYTEH